MEKNETHHVSSLSLASSNNRKLKPFTRLFMDQTALHTAITPKNELGHFNSPSVILSDFGPASCKFTN